MEKKIPAAKNFRCLINRTTHKCAIDASARTLSLGLMKKLLASFSAVLLTLSVFAGEYADITISDLKSAMASKKVTLLDANGTESFQRAHIPGAVDFTAHEGNLSTVLPKDKNALIVAYCANPQCKAYQGAAKAAEKLGYKNIRHLPAGIAGWKQAKEPTEHASAR